MVKTDADFVSTFEILRRSRHNPRDINGSLLKTVVRWYTNHPSTDEDRKVDKTQTINDIKSEFIELICTGKVNADHPVFGSAGPEEFRATKILSALGLKQQKYLKSHDQEYNEIHGRAQAANAGMVTHIPTGNALQ